MSKPDYILKTKARNDKYATRVGAAWRTRSGDGINIRLNAGIALMGGESVDITLWPYEDREPRGGSGGGQRGDYGGGSDNFDDDDVPF